jgi:hypothetical protein
MYSFYKNCVHIFSTNFEDHFLELKNARAFSLCLLIFMYYTLNNNLFFYVKIRRSDKKGMFYVEKKVK